MAVGQDSIAMVRDRRVTARSPATSSGQGVQAAVAYRISQQLRISTAGRSSNLIVLRLITRRPYASGMAASYATGDWSGSGAAAESKPLPETQAEEPETQIHNRAHIREASVRPACFCTPHACSGSATSCIQGPWRGTPSISCRSQR